ncbi:PREDICTED: MKI67 FHA domain-interacting nucleolar phosphoprotein [Ceratosolen solmsi marchali]|uniref:MKI67 FHA domain-interacting nucleolar phosphoprotein n=1 Tax=Ceratosolen solmsi marchali TaxID=326594 RepID=A0AAJ6YTQ3_9HYME|nr:PREDICTED: MKI67 FHA domain-interacting nucleolar phosphoprotein [Ceratosolen solmsi marchali]
MKIKKVKSSRSSALSKAVTNVKQIIKKKDKGAVKKQVLEKPKTKVEESNGYKSSRGVVYIGHIPYGFFEDEMKEYFEQFGTVTRVRVVRSKKTGKSRGYGYIEFRHPEVAKVAAKTMHNYLMCGRLLTTTYIPPEKQHWGFFSHKPWSSKNYPRILNRMKELKKNESPVSEINYYKNVRRSLRQISALEEKLKSSGINIKFKLADVPK